jgi:hypothetical protein
MDNQTTRKGKEKKINATGKANSSSYDGGYALLDQAEATWLLDFV